VLLLLSAGSVYLEMALLLSRPIATFVPALAILIAAALAVHWKLHREPAFLYAWVALSLGFAVFSAATGFYNGLTDEPYATPAFAAQWWPNLYTSPIHISYFQYGTGPTPLSAFYVYLPFLTFIQVPGLDYRWVSLAAWVLTVYLLRKNGTAVVGWGSLYVGLLAASGFNDFVPIAVLTLAFVSLPGWKGKVAEVVGLGLKQFANLFVVAYHLYHRRWRAAALATGVTVAILLPFLIVDPLSVWCAVVLVGQAHCASFATSVEAPTSAGTQPFYAHLNYYLWPLWVVATFLPRWAVGTRRAEYAPARREAAALLDRPNRPVREDSEGLRFLLTVLWVRSRGALRVRKRTPPSGP
jgi:hypothetical protein